MTVTFEGYERRADKINKCLADNGIASLEEALQICTDKGFNPREIVNNTQSIAFQNAEWAYTLGCALAVKRGAKSASEAAAIIGEGIQAFTVPGSVAEDRKVGLGHGNLGAMLLSDDTECFAFLAGHESFAAAEGAIGLALNANKARKKPLRVILNGLGKDAAQIIARINGFTYVQTQFDYYTSELKIVREIRDLPALLDEIRSIAQEYYGDDVILVGNSTNAFDLASSFSGDNMKISILTALFVMVILLFTFKSAGLPVLLIIVIQGSIWINFAYFAGPYHPGFHLDQLLGAGSHRNESVLPELPGGQLHPDGRHH